MNSITKIQFSEREFDLVSNGEWILTKHTIIEKVTNLFGQLLEEMKSLSVNHLNNGLAGRQNGKITKGENFERLPYVILDYPNIFSRENIFAIRIMFWWGNFFSITLHLKGAYLEKSSFKNAEFINFLGKKHFLLCVNKNEWEHHFRADNYLNISSIDASLLQQMSERNFMKIGKYFPIRQWEFAGEYLIRSFQEILECPAIMWDGLN